MLKHRVKYFLLNDVVPYIYAFQNQSILRRKIEKLQQEELCLIIPNNKKIDLDAFSAELKDYQNKENDREKVIEDKAKSSLFIVTLSITVILAGLNFIKEGKFTVKLPLLLLVILGIKYFVLASVTAVKALNVSEHFVLHPDDWLEQGQANPTIMDLQKIPRIQTLYMVIKANELAFLIKTNFVDATFIGIRNGIILLAVVFIIAVGNIGSQIQFYEPSHNNNSGHSDSNINSKQPQPQISPLQGASSQENIPTSDANAAKDVDNSNKQDLNSSNSNNIKNSK